MADIKLYYFEGRNTGIAATSLKEARKKKKRGGDKLVKVRTPTAAEKKKMRNGEWVRTRKDGKSPEKSKYGKGRGKGPPRKKKDSAMIECTFDDCGRTFLSDDTAASHHDNVHGKRMADTPHSFKSGGEGSNPEICTICGRYKNSDVHESGGGHD